MIDKGRCPMGAILGLAAGVALALSLLSPASASEPQEDVTFAGTFSSEGDLLLTFTPDWTVVTRAELKGATFTVPVPGGTDLQFVVSRVLYFYPPRPLVDGRLEVSVPDQLSGQVRGGVRLEGAFTSEDELSGTATFVACQLPGGCQDWATVSWNASGPVDTPPGPDDARFAGELEAGGRIALTIDAAGAGVTSLELDGLVIGSCLPDEAPLTIHTFFDPAAPLDGFGGLVQTRDALQSLHLTGGFADEQTLAGTLQFTDLYAGDCAVQTSWRAEVEPPSTPTATATAAPTPTPPPTQLPPTGHGAKAGQPSWALWLTLLGLLLLGAGLVVRTGRHT